MKPKISILLSIFAFILVIFAFGCNDDKDYIISFIIDGETVATQEVEHGQTLNSPTTDKKSGYVFKGWYLNQEYIRKWNFSNPVTSSTTLYGYYVPEGEETFNVIFTDGGEDLKVSKIKRGQTCDEYTPEKVGYELKNWLCGGVPFSFSEPITKDLELTAEWSKIIYTVSFVADDRTIKRTFDIENFEVTPPEVPEKEHYTAKWESFSLELKDMTVNAVYKPIVYTVEFIADGVTIQKSEYSVEDEIKPPIVPKKDGYSGKWNELPKGGNATVTAEYSAIEYTVTFIIDGKVVGSDTYTVENKEIDYPAIPQKEGYIGRWQDVTLSFGDITISAIYEETN